MLSDDGVVIVTIGFWGTVGRDFRARKSRQTGDRVAKRGRCPHLIFKNSSPGEGSFIAVDDVAKSTRRMKMAGILIKL